MAKSLKFKELTKGVFDSLKGKIGILSPYKS